MKISNRTRFPNCPPSPFLELWLNGLNGEEAESSSHAAEESAAGLLLKGRALLFPDEVAFQGVAGGDIGRDGGAQIRAGDFDFRDFLIEAIDREALVGFG